MSKSRKPQPKATPKAFPWSECPDCGSDMLDAAQDVCRSCEMVEHQEDATRAADTWLDGLPPALHAMIDRDALLDAIEHAFQDAEQELIEGARAAGLMEPM
jgi:hypothetical protein